MELNSTKTEPNRVEIWHCGAIYRTPSGRLTSGSHQLPVAVVGLDHVRGLFRGLGRRRRHDRVLGPLREIGGDRGGLAFGLGAGHLDLGLLHTDERRLSLVLKS